MCSVHRINVRIAIQQHLQDRVGALPWPESLRKRPIPVADGVMNRGRPAFVKPAKIENRNA